MLMKYKRNKPKSSESGEAYSTETPTIKKLHLYYANLQKVKNVYFLHQFYVLYVKKIDKFRFFPSSLLTNYRMYIKIIFLHHKKAYFPTFVSAKDTRLLFP